MQISDMLAQYNRSSATGATATAPQQGVQQLVSAVREMTVGNVFEGTVNDIKNGTVTLGLANGQTVQARIAAGVQLAVGQAMFFQVKSNDGTTVEIRPYTNGNLNNPTLLKALDAAGIPAEPRMIDMVNSMMEEQMSIGRESLMDMARSISAYPDADIKSLVLMHKLDIPMSEEFIRQFENYKSDQAAITSQFDDVLESIGKLYQNENLSETEALELGSRIYQVLKQEGSLDASAIVKEGVQKGSWSPVELQEGAILEGTSELAATEITGTELAEAETIEETLDGVAVNSGEEAASEENAAQVSEEKTSSDAQGVQYYARGSVGALFTEGQMKDFSNLLKEFPQLAGSKLFNAEGNLNGNLSTGAFLKELHQALDEIMGLTGGSAKKLFSGKEYQKVLEYEVKQQWTLKPEEIKGDAVKHLYEKMENQMQKMQELVQESGQSNTSLAKAVSNLQGNIEFMNQINNAYHYVQIPLRMSNQNAHGDLFVYTNKSGVDRPDGELSAFLHLDMDNLGATDVSVRMKDRKVHTNFYLEDEKSYDLIEEHMAELMQRLQEKGYSCTVQVENQFRKKNLVEDFMQQEHPSAGILHRYSFDMRA
mgnify:FL=1